MTFPFRSNQRKQQSERRTDTENRCAPYIRPNSEERRRMISFLHAGDQARSGNPNRRSYDTTKKARQRLIAVFLALLIFGLWGLLSELL